MVTSSGSSEAVVPQPMQVLGSRQVVEWFQQERLSLACSTYQTSRLMLVGATPEGNLAGHERIFDRAMGLYATADEIFLSSKYQIWHLANVLEPGQMYQGCDRLYIPRTGHTTGDLDIHDLVVLPTGPGDTRQMVFLATSLNCIATVSDRHSCQPLWKPPFISKLINEDRCHLNGLAVRDGKPAFVSAVSRSDVVDGWRDRRKDGGVLMSLPDGEIVVGGLSMPHSPRWYGDRLWVLNSGRGELGYVDLQAGKFEPVTFCPGYLRGLAFWKDWAIVGLSKSRKEDKTFGGLALDELLVKHDAEARCGVMMVNIHTGATDYWLRFEGGLITELYDVQVLPGVQRPMALGFQTDDIAKLITLAPMGDLGHSLAGKVSLEPAQPPHAVSLAPVPDVTVETTRRLWMEKNLALPPERMESAYAHGLGEEVRSQLQDWQAATKTAPTAIQAPLQLPTPAPEILQQAKALFDQSIELKQQQNWAKAEHCLRQAIQLYPGYVAAYNNLGTLLQSQGNLEGALGCYETILQLNANVAEAIANRASIWQAQGQLEQAKPEYLRALQLKPDYLPAHLNLANIYKQQGRLEAALQHFQRVVELDPQRAEAYFQMAQILEYRDRPEDAMACYEKVLELDPQASYARGFLHVLKLQLCNWDDYEARIQDLIALTQAGIRGESEFSLSPYSLNFFPVPLELHTAAAKSQAQHMIRPVAAIRREHPFDHSRMTQKSTDRLRIGYISPDFRDHAVGRLLYQIFQKHDRAQFEVLAYATVDVYDVITQQVEQGCDRFCNLAALSHREAAQRIYDDQIDILIDLAGYTIGNGAPILALQPAPIQAQFMGYPDTLGADFIQYAIADPWLIPPSVAATYTEKIIELPHAFVGSSLGIADMTLTRTELGLPETGTVFACFNTHRKITPEVFDAWMEILRQVPGSVLWLLDGIVTQTTANLRQAAHDRGIDPDRLVFRQRTGYGDYLARFQRVDLFLDTFIYSAGSTAIAALWGGAPVLTRPGVTHASRMGASICAAAHLEELICPTTEDYIAKAVHLGTHGDDLGQIRQQLQRDRTTLPLFDIPRFTRSLETAFQQMWTQRG